jgi:hypothetical protein
MIVSKYKVDRKNETSSTTWGEIGLAIDLKNKAMRGTLDLGMIIEKLLQIITVV